VPSLQLHFREVIVFTLDEIKAEAANAADTFEFNWEKLEDPREREYLETHLSRGLVLLPTIESLYTKLTSGKSVVADEDTALSPEEAEHYAILVADELYSAYTLAAIKDKYDKVNSIIALSGSMEL
jgi:hypothetical protein